MSKVVESCMFVSGFLSPGILELWDICCGVLSSQCSSLLLKMCVNGQKSCGKKLGMNESGPESLLGSVFRVSV